MFRTAVLNWVKFQRDLDQALDQRLGASAQKGLS